MSPKFRRHVQEHARFNANAQRSLVPAAQVVGADDTVAVIDTHKASVDIRTPEALCGTQPSGTRPLTLEGTMSLVPTGPWPAPSLVCS